MARQRLKSRAVYYKVDGYVFAEVIREISYSEQSRYQAFERKCLVPVFVLSASKKWMLAADFSDVPFLHIRGITGGKQK